MKRKVYLLILTLVLLLTCLRHTDKAHAFSVGAGIDNPGTVAQGQTVTIGFHVSGDEHIAFVGSVSASGGGSLVSCAISPGQTNGANIAVGGVDTTAANGSITINVSGDTPVVVSLNGDASSTDTFVSQGIGTSITIPVYTTAQQQADQAARDEAARIAASEEAVRQASRDAEYASSKAVQDSIDESIRLEQESLAEIEASEEESRNESIAESASVEESIREESVSIEESIKESEREVSESESLVAASISESESEVERTRAYQIGTDTYFVPYEIPGKKNFLFAVEDTQIEIPEGYERTKLLINHQYVLAYQSPEIGAHTYLVYGMFDESELPALYLYDFDKDLFIPYDSVFPDAELSLDDSTPEKNTGKTVSKDTIRELILIGVLAFVLGAAVMLLIVLLSKIRKERNREPYEADDEFPEDLETEPLQADPEIEDLDADLPEEEQTEKIDFDQEKFLEDLESNQDLEIHEAEAISPEIIDEFSTITAEEASEEVPVEMEIRETEEN